MRSSSVLILGILFAVLLITFCVTRFINNNNPNIKNVSAPNINTKTDSKHNYQLTFKEVLQDNKNEESQLQYFYEQSNKQKKRINMKTDHTHLTKIKTNYKGS